MSLTYNPTDIPIALIDESKIVYIDKDGLSENKVSYLDMKLSGEEVMDLGLKLLAGMTIRQAVAAVEELLSEEGDFKTIDLNPGESIQVIPAEKSERVLVCGKSGRGKSTWAAQYAQLWLKDHPDGDVWVFVRTKDDLAYKGLNFSEVAIDEVDDLTFELEDYSNTLCIFDDMEHITDDVKKKKALRCFMNDLITNGRKLGIYTMCLNHTLMGGIDTKVINIEANKVVIFPGVLDNAQNITYLNKYCGMELKQARALVSMRSRWICLDRGFPSYIIHEKGVILL